MMQMHITNDVALLKKFMQTDIENPMCVKAFGSEQSLQVND